MVFCTKLSIVFTFNFRIAFLFFLAIIIFKKWTIVILKKTRSWRELFTLSKPVGFDDDILTKLGDKEVETLRKMVIRANYKHNVLTKNDTIVQEE